MNSVVVRSVKIAVASILENIKVDKCFCSARTNR